MPPISRRTFLARAAVVAGVAWAPSACSTASESGSPAPDTDPPSGTDAGAATTATSPAATVTTVPPSTTTGPGDPPVPEYAGQDDPFSLGVASGDPDAESVVLWTRLVTADGTTPDGPVAVLLDIEVEDDPTDRSTTWVTTDPEVGCSVHALAAGLRPDRWYRYHFRSGAFTSPIGRARTTPSAEAAVERLVLGTGSCQHYEDGFYAALDDVAAARLDLFVWLGDYIYESGPGTLGVNGAVRLHDAPEPVTLDDYRHRYELYKRDPSLQAAHASCPWFVTWDDHEVDNNYAGTLGQDGDDLTERRASAYLAWWEHTPTRIERLDAEQPIYRAMRWGTLADVSLLDTRRYRSDQACGDVTLSLDPPCAEVPDPERTLLGAEQERWLLDRFGSQGTAWNVMAQQVIVSDARLNGAILNYDQWDGYPAQRDRVLGDIADRAVPNVVVLTGDIHFAAVGNLRRPGEAPIVERPVIGAEFVATSISSGGNVPAEAETLVRSVPGIVDADLRHRGWIRHEVDAERWLAEYRIVDDPADARSTSTTYGRFEVLAGTPGATKLGS